MESILRDRSRYSRRSAKGAILLELTCAVAILSLIGGGVVNYTYILKQKQLMSRAAYAAARAGLTQPPMNPDLTTELIRQTARTYFTLSRKNPDDFAFTIRNVSIVLPDSSTVPGIEVQISREHVGLLMLAQSREICVKSLIRLSPGRSVSDFTEAPGVIC